MWSFARLRQCPHFAPIFAKVHPLCWPILWWQLNRLLRWFDRTRPEDVLYSVNRWGFVQVCYVAPRIDPATYKPLPRTFRPLSDPSWDSALPACLAASFHPIAGEAAPAMEPALWPTPSPQFDTS